MTGSATAVACIAGITFYVAFHHLLMHFRMRNWRASLPFALLCCSVGIYDIYCVGLYNASGPLEGAVWQKLQFLALALVGIFILRFISVFIERKSLKIDAAFMAFWGATILLVIFGPTSWFVGDTPAVKHIDVLDLGQVTYQEMEFGWFSTVNGFVGFAAVIYILQSLVAHYRLGNEQHTLPVLIGVACMSIGVVNDTAVGQGLYPFIYIIEYAYLFLILGMAYSLVSAHLAAQTELHESQERLKLTQFSVDHLTDPVYWADDTGKFIYVNRAACKSLGYTQKELLAMTVPDISPDVPADEWDRQWSVLKEKQTATAESMLQKKDGTRFHVEITVDYLNFAGHEYMCASVRDITDRRKVDEALRFERTQLLTIFDAIPAIVDVVDPNDHEILYANRYTKDLFGADIEGRPCYEVFHPFDQPCKFCNNKELLEDKTKVPSWEYHSEVVHRDFMTTNAIIRWPDGRDVKFELSMDITERKKAEEELKRLAAAVDEAAESIIVTDPGGEIVYVNPAFEKMTGYAEDEIVGEKPGILQSGKHDEDFYADLWKTISSGESWRGRFTNRRKDGALFEEEAVISPVRDETGKTVNYVAVKRDVTQEMELQNQLRHSQKMDALGELAGGVAHDFTNMLVVILGRAQIAKSKVASSSDIHDDLDEIIQAGNKLSVLTGELLAFAHKAPISLKNVNLNKAIKGVEGLLNRTVGKKVDLTINATDAPLLVNIDSAQIEQAIVHFAINARDAMPDGGRLVIETSWLELSETEAVQLQDKTGSSQAQAGKYATVSVSDTGVGMSKEVASRIFDPFFSTKRGKQSAGLGMSTAYGIIAQHEGCITVYSHPGRGTTLTIFLPLLAAPAGEDEPPPTKGSGQTVLLADDDGVARRTLVKILQGLRYTVLEAESGTQCLELAREHEGEIDLLISDYVMPGLHGVPFIEELKKLCPDLKMLFASGYPRSVIDELPKDLVVIQKPFTMREVASAITIALAM